MNMILLLDKPQDMSSHTAISKIKHSLGFKKIGHAGTLDPLATGLLVVLVNDATKLSHYLLNEGKTYVAEITLGVSTDTQDATGTVLARREVNRLSDVDEILKNFQGEIQQIPPMYSAIKQDGKKLYELARSGQEVTRASRVVNITQLKRTSEVNYYDGQAKFSFLVSASKGTYIRTLCVDIGEALGLPAHMSALRRVQSGHFKVEDANSLIDIKNGHYQSISMLDAVSNLETINLDEELFFRVKNGQTIPNRLLNAESKTIALAFNNKLVAIYKQDNHVYRAERVWN